MTFEQALSFAVIGGSIALFIWDRLRYDLVALLALLAGILVGIVPADKAFAGFSDPVVVIIATALIVSAAVARSGVVETAIRPLVPLMTTTGAQVAILVGAVMLLSAFMNNIGALALVMPIAMQIARRTNKSVSRLLMPMAFGALTGGLITLIGNAPNILVARIRGELTGSPFAMFDFAPVGLGIAAAALAFLVFGWRLLPGSRRGRASPEDLFRVEDYVSEVCVPAGSTTIGITVADLEKLSSGDVAVVAIIRERLRRLIPTSDWTVYEDDVLVLEGEAHALQRLIDRAQLELLGHKPTADDAVRADELATTEAVITAESTLIGRSLAEVRLRDHYRVNALAVSRHGRRVGVRLRRIRFQRGDVVVLQGAETALQDAMTQLGLLPLAGRNVQLGPRRAALVPVAVLVAALAVSTLNLVPVAIAFLAAAVALVVLRSITLRDVYQAVDWPIIVLLGALIPVSDTIRTTGASDLIAGLLSQAGALLPGAGVLAMVMIGAMAVTPFLNNAATVLVLAPIATSLAQQLGYAPDGFLMAVAIGATCDFLTPIGHQCNTLVMGPGGYRFADYWKLGLPLSFIVVLIGVPLIMLVWPLSP